MSDDDKSKVSVANFSNLTYKQKKDWVLAAIFIQDVKQMEEEVKARNLLYERIYRDKKAKEWEQIKKMRGESNSSNPSSRRIRKNKKSKAKEEIREKADLAEESVGQEVAIGYENEIEFELNNLFISDDEK